MNVRNLERIEKGVMTRASSFEVAQKCKENLKGVFPEAVKIKIFARYDGTFDVVPYRKIQTPGQKVIKALEELGEQIKAGGPRRTAEIPVVHGQKSKDRKKSPKKAR